mgnify:CR=1 FL=1
MIVDELLAIFKMKFGCFLTNSNFILYNHIKKTL